MGSHVSDYRGVHRRLGPFIRAWRRSMSNPHLPSRPLQLRGGQGREREGGCQGGRAGRATWEAAPVRSGDRPFIIAADVKGAFDSIPLPALERVVTQLVGLTAERVACRVEGVGCRVKGGECRV